jgi:hypothetical protein
MTDNKLGYILKTIDEHSKAVIKVIDGRIREVENDLNMNEKDIIRVHNTKNLIMSELTLMKESIMDIIEDDQ